MGDHPKDRRPRRLSRKPGRTPARDTIAAVASARGRAGVGVLRISGPGVGHVAGAVLGGLPPAREAALRDFRDAAGEAIDRGIAIYFPAPASYTGEDVLELQAHGGVALMDTLLARVLAAGARLAEPGEFTRRAFLGGRMDLAQAEAVADLIEATSEQALRAAGATLRGEFARRVHALVDRLTAMRVTVEAAFDFADEEVDEADPGALLAALDALDGELERTLRGARDGVRLGHGLRAVLAGAPNVGKSSVLNRLAGEDRAIVTPLPGTTRDAIRETLSIAGASVEVVDTAGLRASEDVVERAGMQRALAQLEHADLVLLVVEDGEPPGAAPSLPATPAAVVEVRNKIDLSGADPGVHGDTVRVSALTGAGFEALVTTIARHAEALTGEGAFTARQRHVEALEHAREALADAAARLREGGGMELVAEDLRRAQEHLGGITGHVHSDELLGRIFATFCIGK